MAEIGRWHYLVHKDGTRYPQAFGLVNSNRHITHTVAAVRMPASLERGAKRSVERWEVWRRVLLDDYGSVHLGLFETEQEAKMHAEIDCKRQP